MIPIRIFQRIKCFFGCHQEYGPFEIRRGIMRDGLPVIVCYECGEVLPIDEDKE